MEEAILAFYIYMEVFGLSLNKNTDPHPKKNKNFMRSSLK